MTNEKTEARYAQLMAEYGDKLAEQARERYVTDVEFLESDHGTPIELMIGCAIHYAIHDIDWYGGEGWGLDECWLNNPVSKKDALGFKPTREGLWVWFQVPVGKYCADFIFCLATRNGYAIGAIECDGHDHHNLTKAQAKRDRERDRNFQSLGLTILRYTGSEIWANPLKCVADAISILEKLANEPTAKRWR